MTFANGEKLCYGPIAENDDELVAMVRSAAARFGLSERGSTLPNRSSTSGSPTEAVSPR